jgi:hypothetical protein
VEAHREKNWDSIETTNNRYDISVQKRLPSNKPLKGTIIFIRRTDNKSTIDILGHRWLVNSLWTNRLVRAEVKINKNIIELYQRRREPKEQPLLNKVKYYLNK